MPSVRMFSTGKKKKLLQTADVLICDSGRGDVRRRSLGKYDSDVLCCL